MDNNKIYMQSKDLNVARLLCYYKGSSDTLPYKDAEFETTYTAKELFDAYIKGALVLVYEDEGDVVHYLNPVDAYMSGEDAYVTFTVYDDDESAPGFVDIVVTTHTSA